MAEYVFCCCVPCIKSLCVRCIDISDGVGSGQYLLVASQEPEVSEQGMVADSYV